MYCCNPSDKVVLGPEMLEESLKTVKMVQVRMKGTHDRQKSYVDLKRMDLLAIGDKVLVKVFPMRSVVKFRKKGKLTLRYIGPYEILERMGDVAYKLALPMILTIGA